jgi:aminoglycoside phosphotransferase (APT) family kinase protein
MAVINKIDPAEAAARLTTALERHQAGLSNVRVDGVETPDSSGFSNETLRFDASWQEDGQRVERRLVARVQPRGEGVLATYNLENEHRLLRALRDTAVPVPEVLYLERDPEPFGAPFMIMEYVEGRIPPAEPPYTRSGWFIDALTPEQRALLCDNGLRVLAAIHAVDWNRLGLGFLARPDLGARPIEQQLALYQSFFARITTPDESPTVAAALDWASSHCPDGDEAVVLSWGDAKVGNLIFDDRLDVAAVLDWEMASLASPELDLGWWLFLLEYHTSGIGVPRPDGMPDRSAVIRRYEELSARTVANIDFYEAFGGLRLCIIFHRATSMLIEAGLLPATSTAAQNNPATQTLARLLDLPAPAGAGEDLVAAARPTSDTHDARSPDVGRS